MLVDLRAVHAMTRHMVDVGPWPFCCKWAYDVGSCCCLLAVTAGGYFDPLGLASDGDADKIFRLKTAEIKHGRLAMVAFLGKCCCCCCWTTGVLRGGAILWAGPRAREFCNERQAVWATQLSC
jgi:hypothetical protein